ncbi:NADH-quinone oxidoreductase subunit D [Granulicoccus phenolivorans]|uniref:NADH-quinone oxidoreductase subunit D n=1 Tax=Granulicoccus phenolivorans TaxID=266854 RepID=UPI0003F78BBA|nr:NADH-quinone oxidoreductase subunit D [Granulicoccus phenolivorans]
MSDQTPTADPTRTDPYEVPEDADRGDTSDDRPDYLGGVGDAAEGTVYTASGGDWDEIVASQAERGDERLVVNMGPQHPSTHGVLRLVLETEGETVTSLRPAIGYLHTGIEKSMEFRSWTQGVTFCTRMDYLMPFWNEAAYCLSVERLLGIEDDIPERAKVIRVMLLELNRISSHLGGIGPSGMEIGALTVMTAALREREMLLDIYEAITGLRMNHGFIRPGGVANDVGKAEIAEVRNSLKWMTTHTREILTLVEHNPIFKGRYSGVAHLDLAQCMAMGVTGPMLRSTGYAWDLRKEMPVLDYETYDFDVITRDTCDAHGRFMIRFDEIWESMKIVEQCLERLEKLEGAPFMVDDPKIAWPAQLAIGNDGIGNSNEHIKHIMGESMEALIHHFKIVTEGFKVPVGQAYVPLESPKGELGAHVVSDGGTRPWRAHFRDPSFNHLQAMPMMTEGGMLSDVVVAISTLDPVLGGVDR